MIPQLFTKKELSFERSYAAPIETVWSAWTEPDALRQWWGPQKTSIPECAVDLRVGGKIFIVMEAGEAMGRYRGTRWPMEGTFTRIDQHTRLSYDAHSWTDGKKPTTTIEHTNDLILTEADGTTVVKLDVSIASIGSEAKLAAFGMKWGYKQYLTKLDEYLSGAVR